MDRYKLTDLLLEKGFGDLSPSERDFVLKKVNDSDEYELFRKIAQASRTDSIVQRDESKEMIMQAFDEEMRRDRKTISPSENKNRKIRKVFYWMVAAASLAILLTIGTLVFYPDNDFRIAEYKARQSVEPTTENASTDTSRQDDESKSEPINVSDQQIAELRKQKGQTPPPTETNIQFEILEEDAGFVELEEADQEFVLAEVEEPAEEIYENQRLNDIVVSAEKSNVKRVQTDTAFRTGAGNDAIESDDLTSQPVKLEASNMSQPKNISAARSAEVGYMDQEIVKDQKANKVAFKFKLKRINKQHYVSY